MALTVSLVKKTGLTPTGRAVVADVTFDNSYSAGGTAYTPAMFGLNNVDFLHCEAALGSSTTAYVARADHANKKIQLFNSNGAAPAALLETGTANQSATVVRVIAYELPNL
jgi:hypothetical protein